MLSFACQVLNGRDRRLVLSAAMYPLQITLTHGLRSAKAAPAIATSYLSVVWGILGSLFIFHEVHLPAFWPLLHLEVQGGSADQSADSHRTLRIRCLLLAWQKPSGESILGAVLIILTTAVLGFAEKKKPKPSAAQNSGETVQQPLLSVADRPES
jgi:hypothetical protein